MDRQRRPVVVVGAGIAGLSVARALRDRGVEVLVFARDGGATAAGAGIVSAQFWDPRLALRARRGAEILAALVPVHRVGMAQVALSARTAGPVQRIPGAEPSLPASFLRLLRPDFARRIVAVAWSPEAFWVKNAAVRRALARGIEVVTAEVREVRVDRVRTERGVFPAAAVVVAAGAWSERLTPGLALDLRSAQTAAVKTRLPGMFHVLDTGLYARPATTGALVGDGDAPVAGEPGAAGRARAGFAAQARVQMAAMFRRVGAARGARGGPLAFARGGRPVARVVGGVHVLAGFGGDGLVLAPAYGEALAERLAAGLSPAAPAP